MQNTTFHDQNSPLEEKKSYHSPVVKAFGDIRELTLASGTSFGQDNVTGSYGPVPAGIS